MVVTLLFLPVDACNPQVPGCDYQSSPGTGLTLVALGVLVMLALGVLMLAAGGVALIIFLVRRNKSATAPVPPGWFSDPSDSNRWRWWDGQSWTDNVSDKGPPGQGPPSS